MMDLRNLHKRSNMNLGSQQQIPQNFLNTAHSVQISSVRATPMISTAQNMPKGLDKPINLEFKFLPPTGIRNSCTQRHQSTPNVAHINNHNRIFNRNQKLIHNQNLNLNQNPTNNSLALLTKFYHEYNQDKTKTQNDVLQILEFMKLVQNKSMQNSQAILQQESTQKKMIEEVSILKERMNFLVHKLDERLIVGSKFYERQIRESTHKRSFSKRNKKIKHWLKAVFCLDDSDSKSFLDDGYGFGSFRKYPLKFDSQEVIENNVRPKNTSKIINITQELLSKNCCLHDVENCLPVPKPRKNYDKWLSESVVV